MSSAHDPTAIGRELDGRYRIEEQIGAGGLGTVYRATHALLDRPVAIKLLHVEYGTNPLLRARFEREAKALAALNHPSIVSVTDYGVAGTTPYLVMELLEGQTLAQRLAQAPIAPVLASSLARDLLRALAFVHAHGLVHRDVKPGNVFLQHLPDGQERLKLLDFGLAKFTARANDAPDATLTRAGEMLGTPAYMSPEQVAGDETDARSDVYASGVILFQMLAGRLPFEGDASDQLRGHLASPVPTLAEANPKRPARTELDTVLQRALAKRREDRFRDADEMLRALESIPQPWVMEQVQAHVDNVDGSLATANTLLLAFDTGLAARATPAHTPSAPGAARPRRGFFAWIGWRIGQLFLLGARVLLALAFTVVVIAGVIMYLTQHEQVRPADVQALKDDVSPKLLRLQTAAQDLAAKAQKATQDSLQVTQDSLAVMRNDAHPEGAAAPGAPAPAAETPAPLPAETPKTSLPPAPPAKNPWARAVPKELRALRRSLANGEVGNDHTVNVLRRYNQAHDDDVRGHLLLARLYINRNWRSDALNQFSIIVQIDPAARAAPEMLPTLLGLVAQGAVAAVANDAAALITRAYGAEAVSAIERAMVQSKSDAPGLRRLAELRARVSSR